MIAEFSEIGDKNIVDDFNNYLNKIDNEELGVKETLNFSKGQLEKLLSGIMGKGVTLTEEEFLKLKDVISLKYQSILDNESTANSKISDLGNDTISKEAILKSEQSLIDELNTSNIGEKTSLSKNAPTKELIEISLSKGGENGKEIIKDIISTLKGESIISEKVIDIIKNNINEIKVFNKMSKDKYYYADIPGKY